MPRRWPAQNPEIGLIAAEVFENGICSLLSRLAPEETVTPVPPRNLRLFTDDARPLLRSLDDAALGKLFLMFPDPWPKSRHAKRRFVHPELLAEAARALRPGGEWRIASDDPTYQEWTDEVLAGQDLFEITLAHPDPPRGLAADPLRGQGHRRRTAADLLVADAALRKGRKGRFL